MTNLASRHCKPLAGDSKPFDSSETDKMLAGIDGWSARDNSIVREYRFKNYYQTMAFVNAVAWIAHTEDHHPDMEVSYNRCTITFSTHSIGGLSENDFICAAKINLLRDTDQ